VPWRRFQEEAPWRRFQEEEPWRRFQEEGPWIKRSKKKRIPKDRSLDKEIQEEKRCLKKGMDAAEDRRKRRSPIPRTRTRKSMFLKTN